MIGSTSLFGSNKSRNKTILWKVIDELKADNFILDYKVIVDKKKQESIRFAMNMSKVKYMAQSNS
jgi:hypothetical protein